MPCRRRTWSRPTKMIPMIRHNGSSLWTALSGGRPGARAHRRVGSNSLERRWTRWASPHSARHNMVVSDLSFSMHLLLAWKSSRKRRQKGYRTGGWLSHYDEASGRWYNDMIWNLQCFVRSSLIALLHPPRSVGITFMQLECMVGPLGWTHRLVFVPLLPVQTSSFFAS